jgi:hypothetical protein
MTRPWHIDQRASAAARQYLGLGPNDLTPEMEGLRDLIASHYDDITACTIKEAMLRLGFMPHDDEDALAILKGVIDGTDA